MARTTEARAREILPTATTLTTTQIDAAIESATCLVDQIAGGCAAHLTDPCLERVETYLAAHFAAVTENTLSLQSETDPCSGGSVRYGFKFGTGINGTPYGQMANMLSNGCLAELEKRPAGLYSIGAH